MTAAYDTCSFFAGDTLLHAEVPYRPYGFASTDTPYRLRHDDWSGLMLLVCMLLAVGLAVRLRGRLRDVLRDVFMPIVGKADEPTAHDPLRYSTRLIAVCLLALSATMVTFTYTQHDVAFYLFSETPYIVFGAFLLLWLGYFLVKRMAASFVNWVFFRNEKIFTWQRAYTFLYVAEAMFFFLLALVAVYLTVLPHDVLIMALILVILFKIVLLFKTYQIFFPKMYGTLHLIVYFCTLELMPLLVIQQVLTYSGWLLELKL